MPTPSLNDRLAVLLFAAILTSQAGCVALNVPSQRFHDSSDKGGILGDWQQGSIGIGQHRSQTIVSNDDFLSGDVFPGGRDACIDGGPLHGDPFDSPFDDHAVAKPPEIPWPRFHPVPTRPVFGSADPNVGH